MKIYATSGLTLSTGYALSVTILTIPPDYAVQVVYEDFIGDSLMRSAQCFEYGPILMLMDKQLG